MSKLPFDFDFKNPDYSRVFSIRADRLSKIRKHPENLPAIKQFYRDNPAQFIIDWGCSFDPRNVERGLPAVIPFLLFPKQIEWIEWCVAHWKGKKGGAVVKSRDMGLSWLTVGLGCTLSIFYEDAVFGYGSRKEEYVDKLGDPKSLFWKAREFVNLLPHEFRGGFNRSTAPHMRLMFPDTGSVLIGEAGDNIGRGNRASIYFVDEAAFLERPKLVDASLSQTTNCRIDVSTPNGNSNPFAEKVKSGKHDVFTFHWRDDPRKDDEWYEKQRNELDPVTLAQEVDIDFNASVEGVLIPQRWVQAAIDAHKKIGGDWFGGKISALDVADNGRDENAQSFVNGSVIVNIDRWQGKQVEDIFGTTQRAIDNCSEFGVYSMKFDSDGLGAGCRGDARIINENRKEIKLKPVSVIPFHGGGSVVDKDGWFIPPEDGNSGVMNKDFFANLKAQAWWSLRDRFKKTFECVEQGKEHPIDEMISIDSNCNHISELSTELSQPQYKKSGVGKILIDKAPEGTKSPNLSDSIMMAFAPSDYKMSIFDLEIDDDTDIDALMMNFS